MKAALLITTSLCLMAQACATTSEAQPHEQRPALASTTPTQGAVMNPLRRTTAEEQAILAAARAFVTAKTARDFETLWSLTASPARALMVEVSQGLATRSDADAAKQGFSSAQEAGALDARTFFIRNRKHLATQNFYVYPQGASVVNMKLAAALYVPFPGRRLAVHPVDVFFTDGKSDRVAAVNEDGAWRFIERVTLH
jgi:hypothetical protein